MKAKKILLLLVIIASVTYGVSLYFAIQNYNSWAEEQLLKYPPDIRPYIDVHTFTQTFVGGIMAGVGLLLLLIWTLVIAYTLPYMRRRT